MRISEKKRIIKISLLIFFIFILLTGGIFAFFQYQIKTLEKDKIVNFEELKKENEEYEKFLKELEEKVEKEKKDEEEIYYEYKERPCFIEEKEYPSGSVEIFYSKERVGIHENCQDYSIKRTCSDGLWLGNKKYKYLNCRIDNDCKLEEGVVLKDGEKIKMYSRRIVDFGDRCENYSIMRECRRTFLTGKKDYKYLNCEVSTEGICRIKTPEGEETIVPNNSAMTFYLKKEAEFEEGCSSISKKRFCSDGILSGEDDYKYPECQTKAPLNCQINGIEIKHGESKKLFSREKRTDSQLCKFFSNFVECWNGKLSSDEYIYENCQD